MYKQSLSKEEKNLIDLKIDEMVVEALDAQSKTGHINLETFEKYRISLKRTLERRRTRQSRQEMAEV